MPVIQTSLASCFLYVEIVDGSSLVGFGNFRDAEGGTLRSGDTLWEKNIYRHPRRQGQKPQDDYIMQHDIYSLGVCLLELGLWESLLFRKERAWFPHPLYCSGSRTFASNLDNPLSQRIGYCP
jgi:hypothetical protein